MENLILRVAAQFPARKEQLIFLINNYDIMMSVYGERTTKWSRERDDFNQLLEVPDAARRVGPFLPFFAFGPRRAPLTPRARFLWLPQARTKEFADEALAAPFGGLISFVKEAENALARSEREKTPPAKIAVDPRASPPLFIPPCSALPPPRWAPGPLTTLARVASQAASIRSCAAFRRGGRKQLTTSTRR